MSKLDEVAGSGPLRSVVLTLLDEDFREEFLQAEADCRKRLSETLSANARSKAEHFGRADVTEADLDAEHAALVRYHTAKLIKKLRWVLEDWRAKGQSKDRAEAN